MLKSIHSFINHVFNPLHVYCRLIDIGIKKTQAMDIIKFYEIHIYKLIF